MDAWGSLGFTLRSVAEQSFLASFDPFTMTLNFNKAHGHHIDKNLLSGTAAEPLTWVRHDNVTASQAGSNHFSRVPNWLISHELTHLLQMTSTSSGIRQFTNMYSYQTACIAMIQKVAKKRKGLVDAGLLGSLLISPEAELVPQLEMVLEAYTRMALTNGGLEVSAQEARQHSISPTDGAQLYKCQGPFASETTVWCLELGDFSQPSGRAVILGNVHIFESYALIVEELRSRFDWAKAQKDGLATYESPANGAPFNPYLILPSIYNSRVEQLPGSWEPMLELAVVLDTALMCDDWLTGSPQEALAAFQRIGSMIDVFFDICDYIANNRDSVFLAGVTPAKVAQFQDTLLRGIGAPITSVMTLAQAARDRYSDVIADVLNYHPPLRVYEDAWRWLFDEELSYRVELGQGACPALRLVTMPTEDLRLLAMQVPILTTGYLSPTDGDAELRGLIPALAPTHYLSLLSEITLSGRIPCPIREECTLPWRSACHGVTHNLEPVGNRCTREFAIAQIMGNGVNSFR
jgi:hypothetical protein